MGGRGADRRLARARGHGRNKTSYQQNAPDCRRRRRYAAARRGRRRSTCTCPRPSTRRTPGAPTGATRPPPARRSASRSSTSSPAPTSRTTAPRSSRTAAARLRTARRLPHCAPSSPWVGTFGAHQLAAGVLAAALRSPRADVRRPYTVLSPAELAALLAAAPTLRDRALLSVLLGSGPARRRSRSARRGRPDRGRPGRRAPRGAQRQGNRRREVPIRAELAALLRRYLAETGRSLGETGPLFRAHDRGAAARARRRLTPGAIRAAVAVAARLAGIHAKRGHAPQLAAHLRARRAAPRRQRRGSGKAPRPSPHRDDAALRRAPRARRPPRRGAAPAARIRAAASSRVNLRPQLATRDYG